MGHVGIGFEINRQYIDLAKQRLSIADIWQSNELSAGARLKFMRMMLGIF
jgi:hypothetical protein